MKLINKFIINELAGKYVAVPVGDSISNFGGIIKLNESAAYIFELLNDDMSFDELVNKTVEHFKCDKEDAEKNVRFVVDGLKKQKLLVE